MRTASMSATKPLVDAPPSSPEFIIKKPHDDTRHRPKQWRSLETDAKQRTRMETLQSAAKRVTKTYSKRQSPSSNPNLSERPTKRQRTEPNDDLPPLPPANVPSKGVVKKASSTLDGYFFSSTSASSASTHSSGPSSDCVWSGDSRPEFSPPSSPIARRWTSPRKLRFRPSLLPISGNKEQGRDTENTTETGVKRKRDASGEHDDSARSLRKTRHGRRLSSDSVAEIEDLGSTGCVSGEGRDESGLTRNVKRRRRSSIRRGEGEEDNADAQSSKDAMKRDPAAALDDPIPNNHETGQIQTAATATHNAGKADTSIPNYTMPFKFYVAAATSDPQQPRPSLPATTAKKPARTIQTTLNLSTKQPFKECKLCDTVYNPLHAVDVKLHQLRHAKLLAEKEGERKGKGKERKSV